MPRVQRSFNKEKAICWLCMAALVGGGAYFFFSRPQDFPDIKAVTTQPLPKEIKFTDQNLRPLDQYLAGDCNAFAPYKPPPPPVKHEDHPQVVVAPPPKQEPPKPEIKPLIAPPAKELEVAFMGVVQKDGKSYGLLRCKDGSPPKRVQEGDTLDPYHYTITRIEPTAIFLTDDEGRPYVLRDGVLDVAAAAASSTNPNAVKAPSTTPAPAPAPAPQQKTPATQPATKQPLGMKDPNNPTPNKPKNTKKPRPNPNGEGGAPPPAQ